jgi:glutamine synthetase
MQSQAQYVLRTVEERGIRFVQLWFTDVLGRHKAFHVTPAELEDALDLGMTFDGSSIDGFSRTQESDVLARPDLTTFQLLPWYEEGAGVARVFCDIVNIDGTPFDGCPRQQLRRVLGEARAQGYTFFVAPEIEYFYFEGLSTSTAPVPIDRGSYFDLLPDDIASQLRRRTVLTLEEMGIGVEHAQHEDAPGQHEIDLRYTDALSMGDIVMSVRHVVKELARQADVSASFMPKPLANVQGSGMHTHLSLWRDDQNAFIGNGPYGLSDVATKFIAGLVRHAPEITAVTNQSKPSGRASTPQPSCVSRRSSPGVSTRRVLSTARRTRPPIRIWPSRSFSRPVFAESKATTSCPPRANARHHCPSRSPRRWISWSAQSCCTRRWVNTRWSGSCATSVPNGTPTAGK